MPLNSPKRLYHITVELHNGLTKGVGVKANSLAEAEEKALKKNPTAKGIKRA